MWVLTRCLGVRTKRANEDPRFVAFCPSAAYLEGTTAATAAVAVVHIADVDVQPKPVTHQPWQPYSARLRDVLALNKHENSVRIAHAAIMKKPWVHNNSHFR